MSCCFNSNRRFEEGFSLLELSIVLVILGILGGMGLPLLRSHRNHGNLMKTKEHQTYVLDALAAFVETHRRFPCPADPKARGADYGLEPKERRCQGAKAEGILPFKTLGISERFARDGFKRLMTYAVDPNLADREYENRVHLAPGGRLVVKNQEGFSVMGPPLGRIPDCIAFVLISHGKSGVGAFLQGQGGKIRGEGLSPPRSKILTAILYLWRGGKRTI